MNKEVEALEKLRDKIDMSIQSLSALMGINPLSYYAWKAGSKPTVKSQKLISSAFAFITLLQISNCIPKFDRVRDKQQWFRKLSANTKLHKLLQGESSFFDFSSFNSPAK